MTDDTNATEPSDECRFVNSGHKEAQSLDPWCLTHRRSAICCMRDAEAENAHLRANSMAAAVEAILSYVAPGVTPYEEALAEEAAFRRVADWLSQQAASQASQGGEEETDTKEATMTEPTDEQLLALCILGTREKNNRAVYSLGVAAGVASQAARIAELEKDRERWFRVCQVLEDAWADSEDERLAKPDKVAELVMSLKSDLATVTRERDELKAYGEGRSRQCNTLHRFLNMAAEERDTARAELAEAREELSGVADLRKRAEWCATAMPHGIMMHPGDVLRRLDAHRAKTSATKGESHD